MFPGRDQAEVSPAHRPSGCSRGSRYAGRRASFSGGHDALACLRG